MVLMSPTSCCFKALTSSVLSSLAVRWLYLQVGDGGGGGQGGGVCHLGDRGAPRDQAVTAQAAWKDGSERPQGGGYDWVASICSGPGAVVKSISSSWNLV
eukprot:GFUD01121591.1.p1 GENE.GFUD01121591.1~~GFUD01121591.1.p1  ORF type:complete len:100 (-),score=28.63 GFUD01121591.1:331-630(-)